ncbi:MAG TPA: glycosyltransferase family 39 protein [Anaerolineaceae bacterium]|nr:glycosyltransferase family 39 protein [Anaerolineaceae bacterium]
MKIVWGAILAFLFLAGVAAGSFLLPYATLKSFLDHFSRRGHLDSFTLARYNQVANVLPILGVLLVAAVVLAILFRRQTQAWVTSLVRFLAFEVRATRNDFLDFWRSLAARRPAWLTIALVLGLTIAAAAIRWIFINRPFGHDEAYTFEAFAVRPFFYVITDYSLPNNHIFHTILVRLSYLSFGDAPWAVRLPALLSGIFMVPAAFVLAHQLYDRKVAVLSAALVAVNPVLISYSVDARGYTLVSLLTLLLFSLGVYVRRRKNRFAWLLIGVLSALGFYTIPIFLYPFGILLLWLFLSALIGDLGAGYKNFWAVIRYLLVSGGLTVLLTVILYLPVVIFSGITALIGNSFVSPLSWSDFVQTLPGRLSETWQSWITGVPTIAVAALVIGLLLSLFLHKRIARDRFPMQVAALLWIIITLVIQRPNAWARIWTYMLAPLLIWGSAGILGLIEIITQMDWKGRSWKQMLRQSGATDQGEVKTRAKILIDPAAMACGVLAIMVIVYGISYGGPYLHEYSAPKELEQTAIYLKSEVKEGDIIAIMYPLDVPFWYYARLHGLSQSYFFEYKDTAYTHVYIMVNLLYDETAQSVLLERQKDGAFCNLDTLRKIQSFGYTDIYECERY